MSDNQPYRRPSTKYPPPHLPSQQFPVVGIEDWNYALAQLVELARRRIADHGGLLSDLYQLQQQGNPFLSAAATANMFPHLLAAFREWNGHSANNYQLFKTVITKFADEGRRDLVNQFLVFMPADWEQDYESKSGRGPGIFVKMPVMNDFCALGRYPMGSFPTYPQGPSNDGGR